MDEEPASTDSIDQYKIQLQQVESILKTTNDPAERQSLEALRRDLKELIGLTLQTINPSETHEENTSSRSSLDDEMALFMSEIQNLESAATVAQECDNDEAFDKKLQSIKDELQAMVGKKCSAPHNHAWGTRAYHNAIVCGVDDSREYNLTAIKDFRVRVLFTNPTHREMIPCSYFLEGDCKFDATKCKFSHGELVPFGELQEYKEPDFTKLKRNCVVLAKLSDRLWHKGRVLCANFVDKNCRVRLEQPKKEVDCEFEDLFPIFHDDDFSSDSSDSDSEDSLDIEEAKKAQLIQQSLLTPAPNRALGEWEKHTKGIGSKLMQKMGYIVGTGLGNNGEGIIIPISAQILPPGRSLDHCMELREAANGDKDLFSVERRLQKQQKKQEAINAKSYERESNRTDIFAFLNDSILTNDTSIEKPKPFQRNIYKNHSTKTLNVESVKIADDIRKKQKEIFKLKEAMKRHSTGSGIHKRLQSQLAQKTHELSGLKKTETTLTREQLSRKHNNKLSVF